MLFKIFKKVLCFNWVCSFKNKKFTCFLFFFIAREPLLSGDSDSDEGSSFSDEESNSDSSDELDEDDDDEDEDERRRLVFESFFLSF